MAKHKTPKFIEVTVLRVEFNERSPMFKEVSKITYEPFKMLMNASEIYGIFIEDEDDFQTALATWDSTYYIEESYPDIKAKLIGE